MQETFEQVGTNTSLLSYAFRLAVVVVLAAAVIQASRNPARGVPRGCMVALVGAGIVFAVLAALRLPDYLLITWLPIGVVIAGSGWLLSTKGWPLGHRIGCVVILLLMATPFWL